MPEKSLGRIGILTGGGDCPGLNADSIGPQVDKVPKTEIGIQVFCRGVQSSFEEEFHVILEVTDTEGAQFDAHRKLGVVVIR